MSNDNGDTLKPVEPVEPIEPESKDLHMEITFKEGKSIEVKGPGNGNNYNMPLCLFMLESAKDFIKAHNAKANMPILHKPSIVNRIGGAFGKHR